MSSDGPLDTVGETYLFSVHMLQFLALTFVVPPLLLLGVHTWLLRRSLSTPRVLRAAQVPTWPLSGMIQSTTDRPDWLYSRHPDALQQQLDATGTTAARP